MATEMQNEKALVATARNWLVAATEQEVAIARARTAAEGVRAGLVVNSDAEAQAAVDLSLELRAGLAAIEKLRKHVLETPRGMVEAVNEFAKGLAGPISAAKAVLEGASDAYQLRRRREAAAELERQKAEAAAAAARETETQGVEAVALVAPAAPGRVEPVRGSAGTRVLTRTMRCEWETRPHRFALLDSQAALSWMRSQVAGKILEEPGEGREAGAVHDGIRWWYDVGGATRGR